MFSHESIELKRFELFCDNGMLNAEIQIFIKFVNIFVDKLLSLQHEKCRTIYWQSY